MKGETRAKKPACGRQARGEKQEPRLDAAGKKSLLLTKD
jgi:hypothetical protein